MTAPVLCRACGVTCRPFLREPTASVDEHLFAAGLREAVPEFVLDRCPRCGSLWSADARRDQEVLLRMYAALPPAYFDGLVGDGHRRMFDRIGDRLARFAPGRRLCDVGCGDGALLAHLGAGWDRSGIEPGAAGAEAAARRGLAVRCGTLETCPEPVGLDAVTAIDVIEHVVEPPAFLESVRSRLRPGGVFLAVTGDPTAWPARAAGRRWSYLRWAGHVSVLSRPALAALVGAAGFEVVSHERCGHPASPGAAAWLRVFLLEPARRLAGRPPSWYPFWRDHQLIVGRKR